MTTKVGTKAASVPPTGLTHKQEVELVREAYENFPEASMCLRCVKWNYKTFEFRFIDDEDGGALKIVNLDCALRGLRLFVAAVRAGKLPGLGLPADFLNDTCDWDASAFDALNQMAVFGDVIYG